MIIGLECWKNGMNDQILLDDRMSYLLAIVSRVWDLDIWGL